MKSPYSAECLVGDDHVVIKAETRAGLIIALKDMRPGCVGRIRHNSVVLEGDEKWSIVAEARQLRLSN